MSHAKNDGIRVTPQAPKAVFKKTFWGIPPVQNTEEFHPGAFEFTAATTKPKTRSQTRNEHLKLMEKELEDASSKISELEKELEDNDYSAAETELRLRNILEHQERGIHLRQMHLTTAMDEKAELEEKNKTLEKRVIDVRSKALNRKFQSRFWMTMFILSMTEHAHSGVLMWIGKNIVMPVTTDVLFSSNTVAVGIRSLVFMAVIGYYRVDRLLLKIPSLV